MASGTVVIYNAYDWKLDPRWGRISLSVDRRGVGRVDIQQRLQVQLTEGVPHDIRARLWWFRSPIRTISVKAGEVIELEANVAMNRPLMSRMLEMLIRPSRSLVLVERR